MTSCALQFYAMTEWCSLILQLQEELKWLWMPLRMLDTRYMFFPPKVTKVSKHYQIIEWEPPSHEEALDLHVSIFLVPVS
jgi:hypothetical protein